MPKKDKKESWISKKDEALISKYIEKAASKRKTSKQKLSLLVIPPFAPGSLGDEAMLSSIVDYFRKKKAKIGLLSYIKGMKWKYVGKIDETIEIGKYFFDGNPKPLINFINALPKYTHFFVMGADVLDGHYENIHSVRRIKLLKVASKAGVKATALGFSFNDSPTKGVVNALNELPDNVKLYARDPNAYKRLKKHINKKPKQVADMAFQLVPKESKVTKQVARWVKKEKAKTKGRLVVGFNPNYKITMEKNSITTKGLIKIYLDFLIQLHKKVNCSILFIPHDFAEIKGETSDIKFLNMIYKQLPKDMKKDIMIMKPPFGSREIKEVVGKLDIVLSSRMHLAIACLGQKTPVGCISYQGKFEGLFSYFGLKNVLITTDNAVKKGKLINFFLPIIKRRKSLTSQIRKNLPKVKKLSKTNFQ